MMRPTKTPITIELFKGDIRERATLMEIRIAEEDAIKEAEYFAENSSTMTWQKKQTFGSYVDGLIERVSKMCL